MVNVNYSAGFGLADAKYFFYSPNGIFPKFPLGIEYNWGVEDLTLTQCGNSKAGHWILKVVHT